MRGCALGEPAGTGKAPRPQGLQELLGGVFCPLCPAGHHRPPPRGRTAQARARSPGPRGRGARGQPGGGALQGPPEGTPGCRSSPPAGQLRGPAAGVKAGTQGCGKKRGEKRGPALTCSWHRAARGARAAGRLGTVPRRPGPAGPAPSARTLGAGAASEATFCARGGIGARRVAASARVRCGRRGAAGGRRRLGRFAAPPARAAPPASRGHFSFSAPRAASPRPLGDARVPPVPPSISLPSPKRDSPSASTPRLQPPRLSAGGGGERATAQGSGVSATGFPITHSFGLCPAARPRRLPPSRRRPGRRVAVLTSSLGAGAPG